MFQRYFKDSIFFRVLIFPKERKSENKLFKSKIVEGALKIFRPLALKTEKFFKESVSYKLINRFYD